jgi:predicted RNA-binding Zn-ribbon protein involved in translation (DUF1610 family)
MTAKRAGYTREEMTPPYEPEENCRECGSTNVTIKGDKRKGDFRCENCGHMEEWDNLP